MLRTVSTCFSLFLLASFQPGCSRGPVPQAQSGQKPAETSRVTLVSPEKKALKRTVEEPGTIRPFEETQVIARIPGYVRHLHADIGQKVKGPGKDASGKELPGELLAELDVPEIVAEWKQRKALVDLALAEVQQMDKALLSAQATVVSREAGVKEAKAGLTRAESQFSRWTSEARRVEGLVKSGVIDAQTNDEMQNQLRAAQASLDEARARVVTEESAVLKAQADQAKSAADLAAAHARVEVARAELGRLETLLNFSKLRAPFDGIVTRRQVNTGDFLQPSGKIEGIFTVARLDPVRVVVEVPEADASLIAHQAEVALTVQAHSPTQIQGRVQRTSWALERNSRTLRVEVDLPNPEGILRPGMYVYARIQSLLPESWTLPSAAVIKIGDGMACYRVESGKALRTPVKIGRTDGPFVQVLSWQTSEGNWQDFTGKETIAGKALGLTEGQEVISDGGR